MLPVLALGGVALLLLLQQGQNKKKAPLPAPKPNTGASTGAGSASGGGIGGLVTAAGTVIAGAKAALGAGAGVAAGSGGASVAGSAGNVAAASVQIAEGVGAGIVLGIVAVYAIVATVLGRVIGASRVMAHKLAELAGNPVHAMVVFESEAVQAWLRQEGIVADIIEQPSDLILRKSWYSADDSMSYTNIGYRQPVFTWDSWSGKFGTEPERMAAAAVFRSASYAYVEALGFFSTSLQYFGQSGLTGGGINVITNIRNQEAYAINPPYGPSASFIDYSEGVDNLKVVESPEPRWWQMNDAFAYPCAISGYEMPYSNFVETDNCKWARFIALKHTLSCLRYDTKIYLPWSEYDYTRNVLAVMRVGAPPADDDNSPMAVIYRLGAAAGRIDTPRFHPAIDSLYQAGPRTIGVKARSMMNPTGEDIILDVVTIKDGGG